MKDPTMKENKKNLADKSKSKTKTKLTKLKTKKKSKHEEDETLNGEDASVEMNEDDVEQLEEQKDNQKTEPKEAIGKEEKEKEEEEEEDVLSFAEMGIDDRILLAIFEQSWAEPTPIQETAIPFVLQGRDVLAKARTGSGKTGAYAIPLLHKVLTNKKLKSAQQSVNALILTPSRELCSQACKNLHELMTYCQREINVIDLSSTVLNYQHQKQLLATRPDVIVSTPAKILAHLKDQTANHLVDIKSTLELLVIDEADLLLSFGFEDEMKSLVNYLPRNVQTILLSATLNDEVEIVKNLYLHNPAVLKLKDTAELPDPIQLEQYQIACESEEDKFVLLYSIMKLNLVKGKSLIFVNSVNRCYKVKLFLEHFGIRSCALNSELPINSRMHIIEQFNGGVYDTIIASDEKFLDENDESKDEDNKKKNNKRKDKEYNISRGIDFRNVDNVINFDFPSSTKSYIHRVGRTARGNKKGTALSLVDKFEQNMLILVEEELKESYNYKKQDENSNMQIFKAFKFKMDEIEGFRYRARDVLRSITTVAIKEARLKEIKQELLNSEKLKSYFEENPREAQMLRHDKQLNVTRIDEHLKNVPDYIIPPSLRGLQIQNVIGKSNKNNSKNNRKRLTNSQKKFKKTQEDPLRSFNFAGLKNKK